MGPDRDEDDPEHRPARIDQEQDALAAERLAGGSSTAEQDAITALFNAIDNDGDASISASESKSFIDQLTSLVQSSTSTESTGRNDLARLAKNEERQGHTASETLLLDLHRAAVAAAS